MAHGLADPERFALASREQGDDPVKQKHVRGKFHAPEVLPQGRQLLSEQLLKHTYVHGHLCGRERGGGKRGGKGGKGKGAE
jgi:hypothetical protein